MEGSPKELVERFYHEVWNWADEAAAKEILHADFRFRGSLGSESRGPERFIAYMRLVHAALADYNCRIDDLIATYDRAAARMTFSVRPPRPPVFSRCDRPRNPLVGRGILHDWRPPDHDFLGARRRG